ncbi:MAG: hypothetical protein JWM65_650 [Sphingomonas bacterium]|nr:hypothetical protein [Sphingomonas bacterium]
MKEGLGLKPAKKAAKSRLRGLAGLAVTGENGYISRNLWFSYDRVLRVGPSGPALFYYLNEPDADTGAGFHSGQHCRTALEPG